MGFYMNDEEILIARGLVEVQKKQITELQAQRDELAAALREFVTAEKQYREVNSGAEFDDPLTDAFDTARAALAKLKGGE